MNTTSDNNDILHINLPIIIRQATAYDMRLLEWQGQFRHYRRIFERAYREQLGGYKYLLVATLNEYPVARLFIQFKGRRTLLADGVQRGYLYSLHVMQILRGTGIGTRLITKAETLLRDRQYDTATIAVAKTNTGALRLYERLNYRIFAHDEGRWQYHDHRGRLHQVHEPSYLLAKSLLPDAH